jgi:hypothetical protein
MGDADEVGGDVTADVVDGGDHGAPVRGVEAFAGLVQDQQARRLRQNPQLR